jgi:transcriptional regulator with XRE-family HTH domain
MQNRLHECRRDAGFTLAELATQSGVPISTLHRADQNPRVKVALANALAIARALRIEPQELLVL